jgi:hypothetical protein
MAVLTVRLTPCALYSITRQNLDPIRRLGVSYGLWVVEDAAEAVLRLAISHI